MTSSLWTILLYTLHVRTREDWLRSGTYADEKVRVQSVDQFLLTETALSSGATCQAQVDRVR